MDGTKPVMESNAEETQDEGQESKGTRNQPLTCFFLLLFILISFGDICVCASPERFNLLAMAPRPCATQ